MSLKKRYAASLEEPAIRALWENHGVARFDPDRPGLVFAIDTPPPTVSGKLHMGHVYSYCQTDFVARYQRMAGKNVFYPMGFDDNGLPTERLVQKTLGLMPEQVGREAFASHCTQVGRDAEMEYERLFRHIGLAVDWSYAYTTNSVEARRISQHAFLDLYGKGRVYRAKQPCVFCPECRTAIAQAELNDAECEAEFITLAFRLDDDSVLPIATTRPELLSACVAIFVHPQDDRYRHLEGKKARVPLYGQWVPIHQDVAVDPEKGTGAVMCCTFGDATDVEWWRIHRLPLKEAISSDGKMSPIAGPLAGLTVAEAKRAIRSILKEESAVLTVRPIQHSIRVHERCDTPVEYSIAEQWFIRLLDMKETLLQAGQQIRWHPSHMGGRYADWVRNLQWDWCISRQRVFGVPFPLWFCRECGAIATAPLEDLPVDPIAANPRTRCSCGCADFMPETDVMDTWATSSLTPQIAARWLSGDSLYRKVFPMTLRPQAHDIIRTWAFYTIVRSLLHFGALPWKEVAISGWGLAPPTANKTKSEQKLSKSRDDGAVKTPQQMLQVYSADAIRYWAAGTAFGKDALISDEKIQAGEKLLTKLWNVARFAEPFLPRYDPGAVPPALTPGDRWILSRLQKLISRSTELFQSWEYSAAREEIERFFWNDLADNYIEMAKKRLYEAPPHDSAGAVFALLRSIATIVKLFAPFLPHVTEKIHQECFARYETGISIHNAPWPIPDNALVDDSAEAAGTCILAIASAVRKFKSDLGFPLRTEIDALHLLFGAEPVRMFEQSIPDILSITRAREIAIGEAPGDSRPAILKAGECTIAILLAKP